MANADLTVVQTYTYNSLRQAQPTASLQHVGSLQTAPGPGNDNINNPVLVYDVWFNQTDGKLYIDKTFTNAAPSVPS